MRLELDAAPYSAVIKLNAIDRPFEHEAAMLRHLREVSQSPCPEVYAEDASGKATPHAYLLLQTLPGVHMWELPMSPDDRQRVDRDLASVVLELHSHTRELFGGVEGGPGHESWVDVFVPRLHEVRRRSELAERLPPEVLARIDAAIHKAPTALRQQGRPTLIHGDIWAANILVRQESNGWRLSGLVDPAAQYADVEMELAYLEEFSCVVGSAFFAAYGQHSPAREGYEYRRLFYWLHSYLTHVWLFEDQHYRDKAAEIAARILLEEGRRANGRSR